MLVYLVIETALAFIAIAFHDIFVFLQDWTLNDVLPPLSSHSGHIFKWILGVALIFPQTILLGATFPLLATAMIRRWRKEPGHIISLLYFSNSLGAVIGVLASGILLIPSFGLPGTGLTAALINLLTVLVIWLIWRQFGDMPHLEQPPKATSRPKTETILIMTAAITGLSSFAYEIVWIRYTSILIGSSVDSLKIILAVFIAGLAFGGYVIHWYADRITKSLPLLASSATHHGKSSNYLLVRLPTTIQNLRQYVALCETRSSYAATLAIKYSANRHHGVSNCLLCWHDPAPHYKKTNGTTRRAVYWLRIWGKYSRRNCWHITCRIVVN